VLAVKAMTGRWAVVPSVLAAVAVVTAVGTPVNVHAQAKTRVAVTAFENKVKTALPDASWKIGEGLAEMLTTELVKTGQFIVVERQGLGDVVGEQALGQSGLVRGETAARTGQMLGAQIVVRGAVTEFEERASGGGGGVGGRNFSLGGGVQNAHVAIDLRLIDTSSGQVIASQNISKVAPAAGGGFGARTGGVAFGGDIFYQTPLGKATRAAMQEAVQFVVARAVRTGPASFSIVKVEGTMAYINAGAGANIRVGHVFQVYSRGEDLVDPDTGLKLGSTDRLIGSVRVTEVQEQFSVGTIENVTGAIKRGDRVR
jgi:curli biogenesis system outer membrane secretion channel CsgG